MDPYFEQYLGIASIIAAALWTFLRGILHNRIISVKKKSPNHYKWGAINAVIAVAHSLFLTRYAIDWVTVWTALYMLFWFWLLFDPFLVILRNQYKKKRYEPTLPLNYISSRRPSEGGAILDYTFHKIPNVLILIKIGLIVGSYLMAIKTYY